VTWQYRGHTAVVRRGYREYEYETDGKWVETRNGAPESGGYVYGARRPRFALEAIARAEAEHGTPD
jgi:hypothetical protein